jgi:hypothetical protein
MASREADSGYWMMWELGGSKDPFEYFVEKYGPPIAFAAGKEYKGEVPEGVKDMSDRIDVPKNHIWITGGL